MSEWAPKRFWTDVTVGEATEGFAVQLDGKRVKTPAKRALVLPTRHVAEQVAAEWLAVEDRITPETMPWTRSANAALDKVAAQRDEVTAHLIGYAASDLLCYRAADPASLVELQNRTWDPILAWCQSRYDVQLVTTSGVMPVTQPEGGLERLKRVMEPMNMFHVTAFHDLVTLSGSYVLALVAIEQAWPINEVWDASRLDEDWQAEQWGVDAEASEAADIKRAAFLHAAKLYQAA